MKIIKWLLLIPITVFAQNYQFEPAGIPVQYEANWSLISPFCGGTNTSDPHLIDIDADGDLDLLIGGFYRNLVYFKNNGNPVEPQFHFITRSMVGEQSGIAKLVITFADLDNDGDYDFLGGRETGVLLYYENLGDELNPIFELITANFSGINVGADATPFLVDIDNDGDFDLFIGKGSDWISNPNSGKISFYLNIGTPELYDFELVTDFFDSIDVGYQSRPVFTDIDADGDYDLFIGEMDGNINFYRNIETPEVFSFVLEDTNFAGESLEDFRTFPGFGDIDNDGDLDLFVGTDDGNLNGDEDSGGQVYYYENIGDSINYSYQLICSNYLYLDIGQQSGIALGELYQEGIYDMYLGRGDGHTFFYRNIGTSDSAHFLYDSTMFNDIEVTYLAKPAFCDIDNDGDQDLFLGREIMMSATSVHFYRNTGAMGNPVLEFELEIVPGYTGSASPALTDIDSDGDFDLFIGKDNGFITYYENVGTPEDFRFWHITDNYQNIQAYDIFWTMPAFCDIDGDGDQDIFIGDVPGDLYFYINIGTPDSAIFEYVTNTFIDLQEYGQIMESDPEFVDIDNDGDFDLFVGCADGGVLFYRNLGTSIAPDFRREFGLNDYKLYQNYPNPFNSSTTISFSVPTESPVEIAVYDNLGRKVVTLVEGIQSVGTHKVDWDAKGFSSGVYYISLESNQQKQTQKVILLK